MDPTAARVRHPHDPIASSLSLGLRDGIVGKGIRIRAESLGPIEGLRRWRVLPDGRGRPGHHLIIRSWRITMYLPRLGSCSGLMKMGIQHGRRRLEGVMCPDEYRIFGAVLPGTELRRTVRSRAFAVALTVSYAKVGRCLRFLVSLLVPRS